MSSTYVQVQVWLDRARQPAPGAATPDRSGRWFVLGAVCVCVVLHFPALLWPLGADESGFLLITRSWDPQPDNMYGHYWVARPPVLLWMFQAADALGGAYMPRLFVAALAGLMVVAAYRVGVLLAGPVAGRWTAAASVALVGNPYLTAWQAKSESFGMPLVMCSCWLALEALRCPPGRSRYALAAGAGMVGVLAIGMKQNLTGGLVFGGVLLLGSVLRRRLSPREGSVLAGMAFLGAAVPVLAVMAWAIGSGVHLSTLWEMTYAFRSDALETIASGPMDESQERARELVRLGVESGLAVIIGWFVVSFRRASRTQPAVAWAVVAMLLTDLAALVLGGHYWPSYLIALIPGAALCVALLSGVPDRRAGAMMRLLVVLMSLATALALWSHTAEHTDGSVNPGHYYTGMGVGRAARPDDTILVLYGHANVVAASGLRAPYPYLWALPARTRDPDLARMRTVLAGPQAPTWVVESDPGDTWDLDEDDRLRRLLHTRYTYLGPLCGRTIWRRTDQQRPSPFGVDCDRPWWDTWRVQAR
ncbi:MAG: hypothetical protein GEU93_10885 [Propionibacteriales bacterium]|nr:hypothetical protein [Propionibacteriales bacterium]